MNFAQRARPENPGFQLAPMIDIVFLLLSFFVATQIFAQWETEVPITLPTASETWATPQRLPGEIIINITAEGNLVLNNNVLELEDLIARLRMVSANFKGQPVLIRADESTDYKYVFRVLDGCRRADIWNIKFAAGLPE